MEEITLYKGLFDLILWGLIVYMLSPAFKLPFRLKKQARLIGSTLILMFCLYPFWGGDYYHLRDSFEFIRMGGYNQFEDVYGWIINNCGKSYTFFRFIIWGSALFILFVAYKRVGRNYDLSLFFFGSLFVVRFSYARVSLAMAIILLGMTIFYKPLFKRKYLSYLLGLAITCSAVFFHRSAVIGVCAAILTFFLIRSSKWKIIFVSLFTPFVMFAASYLLGNLLNMSFEAYDVSLDGKIESYLTNTVAERGIAVKIQNFLQKTPMYLSAFMCAFLSIKGKIEQFSIVERSFAYYVFIIMLISFGLSFDYGYETSVVATRTMCFAMPANAVFLMSIKSRRYYTKLFNLIYYMAFAASLYALLYATYMGYNRM